MIHTYKRVMIIGIILTVFNLFLFNIQHFMLNIIQLSEYENFELLLKFHSLVGFLSVTFSINIVLYIIVVLLLKTVFNFAINEYWQNALVISFLIYLFVNLVLIIIGAVRSYDFMFYSYIQTSYIILSVPLICATVSFFRSNIKHYPTLIMLLLLSLSMLIRTIFGIITTILYSDSIENVGSLGNILNDVMNNITIFDRYYVFIFIFYFGLLYKELQTSESINEPLKEVTNND